MDYIQLTQDICERYAKGGDEAIKPFLKEIGLKDLTHLIACEFLELNDLNDSDKKLRSYFIPDDLGLGHTTIPKLLEGVHGINFSKNVVEGVMNASFKKLSKLFYKNSVNELIHMNHDERDTLYIEVCAMKTYMACNKSYDTKEKNF